MSLLDIRNIHTHYGKIHALKGVSLTVEKSEIVTLIGGNGAGKTTILNTISGITPAEAGIILLDGHNITRMSPHEIVSLGIIHSPEGRKIFTRLTVRENLEMGAFARKDKAGVARDMEFVLNLFDRLPERQNLYGGLLPGGEQQMLAIARAVMGAPRVLLLDEPSMSLAPLLVKQIFDVVAYLNKERQTTILLVEQNALMALAVANRAYVLQSGYVTHADTAEALRRDVSIVEAYLGG